MRRWVRVWGLAVLVLLLGACGEAEPRREVLTDSDTGSNVLLDSGDQLEIRLESNPTTGYQWVIPEGSLPAVLELVEDRYQEPDTDLVGAPGTQVFVFEALEEGAGILRLEYIRPFEDLPIPDRVVEFIVQVDGAPWPPRDVGTPPGTSTASVPNSSP